MSGQKGGHALGMTLLLLILLLVVAVAIFSGSGGFRGSTVYRRRPARPVIHETVYEDEVVRREPVVREVVRQEVVEEDVVDPGTRTRTRGRGVVEY